MRVIAGEFKGRRLLSPEDERVRPTTDKVKEAIFSMLAFDLPGAAVCDLFAGTGSLGLEALSRGARHCYFCDSSRDSLKLIKENIRACGAEEGATVLACDFRAALGRLPSKVDIFLLDPPYGEGLLEEALSGISELGLLSEEGIIVCEHGKREELPEITGELRRIKEKKYGKIAVSIYGQS